jgi:hypothetical protein
VPADRPAHPGVGPVDIAGHLVQDRVDLARVEGSVELLQTIRRYPSSARLGGGGCRGEAEVAPALITLMKWGDRHYPTPGGPPRLTLHTGCGGAVRADLSCERCGDHVGYGELELRPGPGAGSG